MNYSHFVLSLSMKPGLILIFSDGSSMTIQLSTSETTFPKNKKKSILRGCTICSLIRNSKVGVNNLSKEQVKKDFFSPAAGLYRIGKHKRYCQFGSGNPMTGLFK